MALNRRRLAVSSAYPVIIPARGGFVPPGMPGHSPEIAMPYDPEQARALLRAAGFGAGLPPLKLAALTLNAAFAAEVIEQWQQELGVPIDVEDWTMAELMAHQRHDPPHLFLLGWIADYPDPHNYLAEALPQGGDLPDHTGYWTGVLRAGGMLDIRQRMALYHTLDRQLLVEDALCIPLGYGRHRIVKQPHTRHFPCLPVAYIPLKDAVLAE
jgi:oligopeptide transport system substrate-binding protein